MENPYKVLDAHIGEIMTYPTLCRLIGEDAKSGKGRELHLKKIAQYVNIDRESVPRKLVIREVYLPDNFKLNKPRGKTYPYIKEILLENLQNGMSKNVTTADLLRILDVVPEKYIVGAYSLENESSKYVWKTKKRFQDLIAPDIIAQESLSTFFMVTRSVINEAIRSALRILSSKGLIDLKSSLCLIRHEKQILDGETKSMTKKHYLTEEERAEYFKLVKTFERRYQVDTKKLFYAKGENMDDARADFGEEMEEFVTDCGYESYVTSYIITITKTGLFEKLSDFSDSRTALKEAINTSIIDKCQDDLAMAIPNKLLEEYFADYLNIHLSSI